MTSDVLGADVAVGTSLNAKVLSWHALPPQEVVGELATCIQNGLISSEANERQRQYGPNVIRTEAETKWYQVLGRQFIDILIFILLVAAGISLAVGELTDAITILTIVVLNGLLGFIQEWKAERALAALKAMLSPKCRVVRDGDEQTIAAAELVPGDLVLLEAGDRVPADLRLVEMRELKVDESSLTGESISVGKQVTEVAEETPLAERRSIAWAGTAVTNGRALGVTVATGEGTEFGRIARLTRKIGTETTTLQRELSGLGKQLGVFALSVSVLVGLAGWWMGKTPIEMFMTGISLAVAVVPEGLPAVVTLTMALGIRAMVRRKALLRRLQAAEGLGAA